MQEQVPQSWQDIIAHWINSINTDACLRFKMKTTRNRSLNVAIKKAMRNKEDSKALELLADLSNLQKENYFLYQPVNK